MNRRVLKTVFGVGISALLLLWLWLTVDWDRVGQSLATMSYWPLVPAAVLIWIHFQLRAVRWSYLLPEEHQSTQQERFNALMVGNLANFILPLRAGEFIRPYILASRSDLQFSVSFVSIVIERFFDLTIVLLSFALVVPLVGELPLWVYSGAFSLGALAMCILVFIALAMYLPEFVDKCIHFFCRILPKAPRATVTRFLDGLCQGARLLKTRKSLVPVFILSVLVWVSCYLLYFAFLFMLPMPHSMLVATAVAVVIALAVAAPSAPGFIGVYQTGCVAAFALFPVDKGEAVAYSIVSHAYQYLLFVLIGGWCLFRLGLRVGDLALLARREESAAP